MISRPLRYYIQSCGLLLLPILLWNFLFIGYLPPALATDEFSRDIPSFVVLGENTLRTATVLLPFMMPLRLTTAVQKRYLILFLTGLCLYFLSWLVLMAFPHSLWSTSWVGVLAPAYTPSIWLVAIGLLGEKLYWPLSYRRWIYFVFVSGFVVFHLTHAYIVFARNY